MKCSENIPPHLFHRYNQTNIGLKREYNMEFYEGEAYSYNQSNIGLKLSRNRKLVRRRRTVIIRLI